MFVLSAPTFLLVTKLISTKITFFNPCHPFCVVASYPNKKIIPLPNEGTIEGSMEWEHKNHKNIAQNKLELKKRRKRNQK